MAVAPTPAEIFHRAAREGERRLHQSLLELVATAFIAGFTIVFGIVALATVHGLLEPGSGAGAKIVGALAFSLGVVFLVVGRAELFSENFFDPVAAAVQRWQPTVVTRLLRLWGITFLVNLAGGGLFALILSGDGVLPAETHNALVKIAEEIKSRDEWAGFLKAVAGGALVTLLSFLLAGAESLGSRIAVAYMTGFLLGFGPFDHVIVTGLYLIFGVLVGAEISVLVLAESLWVVTAGNLAGGLGLVTLTHIAQAKGQQESEDRR